MSDKSCNNCVNNDNGTCKEYGLYYNGIVPVYVEPPYDEACDFWTDDPKKKNTLEKMRMSEDGKKQTMNDYSISRQAAIEAANEAADDWDGGYSPSRYKMIEDAINALPSAEPQRKTGYWIERDDDCTWECSACGELWTLIDGTPKQNNMNYCPNCGAEMKGADYDQC